MIASQVVPLNPNRMLRQALLRALNISERTISQGLRAASTSVKANWSRGKKTVAAPAATIAPPTIRRPLRILSGSPR